MFSNEDFLDGDHLNIYGSKKFTDMIHKIIEEKKDSSYEKILKDFSYWWSWIYR